ncbi:MAG: flagellar export chaperone FliS [Deltaproteobacteria bacterium]|nr:flagellar export chaperone FliS [Deltaproteobacteria bacterium]
MYGTRYQVYQQTDILTADPKRLVMICYEEAIRNLNIAKAKYLSKEYEAKGKALQKSLNIISELRETLDFERGGEIAKHLDRLYGFMTRHIIEADQRRNVTGFSQAAAMIEELKSAWEQAFYAQPDNSHEYLSQKREGSYPLSL